MGCTTNIAKEFVELYNLVTLVNIYSSQSCKRKISPLDVEKGNCAEEVVETGNCAEKVEQDKEFDEVNLVVDIAINLIVGNS